MRSENSRRRSDTLQASESAAVRSDAITYTLAIQDDAWDARTGTEFAAKSKASRLALVHAKAKAAAWPCWEPLSRSA